jgi:hypothetical protein
MFALEARRKANAPVDESTTEVPQRNCHVGEEIMTTSNSDVKHQTAHTASPEAPEDPEGQFDPASLADENEDELPEETLSMPDDEELPEEKLDYTQALTPVPAAGTYEFQIIAVGYVKSALKENRKQKHMLRIELQIIGAQDPKHEIHVGKHVIDHLVFIQSSVTRLARFAQAAGAKLPRTITKTTLEALGNEINGVTVFARLRREEYNGEMRACIASYGAPTPRAPKK